MIYGIGTDICDIRRIAASVERHGERFAQKVLTDSEIQVWNHRRQRLPARGNSYLATRFAVKEAFSKAIGLGMRSPMGWHACEILNMPSGQPGIVPLGDLKLWCEARHLQFQISLSDEKDYAVAFCIAQVVPDNQSLV